MVIELCNRCVIRDVCDLPGCMRPQPTKCKNFVQRPKTNYDRMHGLNVEEMAAFLDTVMSGGYGKCPDGYYDCSNRKSCAECWLDWLKQEAKDGD